MEGKSSYIAVKVSEFNSLSRARGTGDSPARVASSKKFYFWSGDTNSLVLYKAPLKNPTHEFGRGSRSSLNNCL